MTIDDTRFSRAFYFVLHDGRRVYPIRMKRRTSGDTVTQSS